MDEFGYAFCFGTDFDHRSEFDGSSHECESGLVSLREKLAEWTLDCDVGLPKTTISGLYSVC